MWKYIKYIIIIAKGFCGFGVSEVFKVDEVIEDADLVNFVDASSKKRPVIVYCRPEEADNLKQTLTNKTSVHQDEDILKVLGSLESSEYAN